MTTLYEYRLSGRRPAIWGAGAVFLVISLLMASEGAALVIWIPVLLGGAMILWALIRNPVNGVQVTEDSLILSPWSHPRLIPLSQIEAVKYREWSDSTDMHIWLKSGETIRVAPMDMPPVAGLQSALAGTGIRILKS